MRPMLSLVALVAACGFHPSGQADDLPAGDDAAPGDGAAPDGATPPDARPVDAPPVDAPSCPADYVATGGSRYAVRTGTTSIALATADCGDDLTGRTHLATFENADLDAVLTALNADTSAQLYIAGDCTGTGVACDDRGNWIWRGGTSRVSETLWRFDEPSSGLSWSYATHEPTDGWVMRSSAGAIARQYVCECDP